MSREAIQESLAQSVLLWLVCCTESPYKYIAVVWEVRFNPPCHLPCDKWSYGVFFRGKKISHHLQNNWGILGEPTFPREPKYQNSLTPAFLSVRGPHQVDVLSKLAWSVYLTNRLSSIAGQTHARVDYGSCFQKQKLCMRKSSSFVQSVLGNGVLD